MSTRDSIVQYAIELIQTFGYQWFSFDTIAKKIGIRKAIGAKNKVILQMVS